MENKNLPAFPILDPNGSYYREGMSKREYFTAMAMQGFAANPNVFVEWDNKRIAQESVLLADALLAELEK